MKLNNCNIEINGLKSLCKSLVCYSIRTNLFTASSVLALYCFFQLIMSNELFAASAATIFILTWQIYTLDRIIIHPEDQQNFSGDINRIRFIRRNKKIFTVCLILSFLAEIVLIIFFPYLLIGVLFCFLYSIFYMINIPFLNFRIKKIPFFKPFYIGIDMIATFLLLAWIYPKTQYQWLTIFFIFILLVMNVILFDLKDTKNDLKESIRTFANSINKTKLIFSCQVISLIVAAAELTQIKCYRKGLK